MVKVHLSASYHYHRHHHDQKPVRLRSHGPALLSLPPTPTISLAGGGQDRGGWDGGQGEGDQPHPKTDHIVIIFKRILQTCTFTSPFHMRGKLKLTSSNDPPSRMGRRRRRRPTWLRTERCGWVAASFPIDYYQGLALNGLFTICYSIYRRLKDAIRKDNLTSK